MRKSRDLMRPQKRRSVSRALLSMSSGRGLTSQKMELRPLKTTKILLKQWMQSRLFGSKREDRSKDTVKPCKCFSKLPTKLKTSMNFHKLIGSPKPLQTSQGSKSMNLKGDLTPIFQQKSRMGLQIFANGRQLCCTTRRCWQSWKILILGVLILKRN